MKPAPRKPRPGDAVRAHGWKLLQKVDVEGRVMRLVFDERVQCMRCLEHGFLDVGLTDKTWEDIPYCVASCDRPDWDCPKCDEPRISEHVPWCEKEYPEARAEWREQLAQHKAIIAFLLPYAIRATVPWEDQVAGLKLAKADKARGR